MIWQEYLEEAFPASKTDKQGIKRLDQAHLAIKVGLDQTLGATFNVLAYIAAAAAFDRRNVVDSIKNVCS